MTPKNYRRRVKAATTVTVGAAVLAAAATALARATEAERPATRVVSQPKAGRASLPVSAARTSQTEASARAQTDDTPKKLFDEPFVDGFLAPSVAIAAQVLSFRPAVPASLGSPVKVFVHRYYRPQALALVYNHPILGRLVITQAPLDMPESVARQYLEQLPAVCDPATGCVGSWTMHELGIGNRALLIAGPQVTAVAWIRTGGIRFDLLAPARSMTPLAALAVAKIIEAAG